MSEIKKVYFENYYTPYIQPDDEEFLYELLSVFYDYSNGLIEDTEELEVMNYVVQELEFIRSIPGRLEEEGENTEEMTDEELYNAVYEAMELTIEDSMKNEEDQKELLDGLSVRVALGLGMVYEGEECNEEDLIVMEYDDEEDEVLFSNLMLPGDEEEEDL